MNLGTARTALIVVDMQHASCTQKVRSRPSEGLTFRGCKWPPSLRRDANLGEPAGNLNELHAVAAREGGVVAVKETETCPYH